MKDLVNIEVFNIETVNNNLVAHISYQDLNNIKINNPNNGYSIVTVPINLREIQRSERGNILVDQSVKINSDESNQLKIQFPENENKGK